MKSKLNSIESWPMIGSQRVPIPFLLVACFLMGTVLQVRAQGITQKSAEQAAIHYVTDEDLETQFDDMNLKILATIHKVAVPQELIERTPQEDTVKLGQEQYLFRLKLTNLTEKPFYFNHIGLMLYVQGHPDAKSANRFHQPMQVLTELYDLKNFKPANKQRIAAWKIGGNDSLMMIITSEGDPYAFTKLARDRNFVGQLTTQINGVFMPAFETQLPLLENLPLEESDNLGPGVLVKFEKLELKRVRQSRLGNTEETE